MGNGYIPLSLAMLCGALLYFATNAAAAFVIHRALFGLMAFGLPITLAAQSKWVKHDCKGIIHTHTGSLSAGAAAAQILLIPVGAVFGLLAFILLAM